jgi:hypothetical protein
VVRAYQATAAEAIEQYEGHMAQYLGGGLLLRPGAAASAAIPQGCFQELRSRGASDKMPFKLPIR